MNRFFSEPTPSRWTINMQIYEPFKISLLPQAIASDAEVFIGGAHGSLSGPRRRAKPKKNSPRI